MTRLPPNVAEPARTSGHYFGPSVYPQIHTIHPPLERLHVESYPTMNQVFDLKGKFLWLVGDPLGTKPIGVILACTFAWKDKLKTVGHRVFTAQLRDGSLWRGTCENHSVTWCTIRRLRDDGMPNTLATRIRRMFRLSWVGNKQLDALNHDLRTRVTIGHPPKEEPVEHHEAEAE